MLIQPEVIFNYIKQWISLNLDKLHKSSYTCVITGGSDSTLTAALCLRNPSAKPVNLIFMGFKPDNEEAFKKWITLNINPNLYKIIIPNHPADLGLNISNIDIKQSMITTYVDMVAKDGNSLTVGAITKSEYSLVKFFKTRIDDVYDCYPIIDLYKSETKELAKYMGLPDIIIDSSSITEQSFGYPYSELEWLDRENTNINIVSSTDFPNTAKHWAFYNENRKAMVAKVFQLNKMNINKLIPSSKMCFIRDALPGVVS